MNKHCYSVETPQGQVNYNYLAVNSQGIPQDLKNIPHWVVWFAAKPLDENKTKPDKIPLTISLHAAKSNDIRTWSSFDDVFNVYDKLKGEYKELNIYGKPRQGIIAGIGFMLEPKTGITGVDIDGCVSDNKLNVFAQDITNRLNTYTEISPSGTGIRAFVYANKPEGRCKHTESGFEIYSHGRFLTLTGHQMHGDSVRSCQDEVNTIHAEIFSAKKMYNKRHQIPEKNSNELLKIAFASKKNGKEIEALYNGNYGDDHSAADLAFCNHLAFWFGKNYTAMDDVFRSSGLMRPKWDTIHVRGETYGAVTLQKAIDNCKECYKSREFDPQLGTYVSIAKEVSVEPKGTLLNKYDNISIFDFPNVTDKFKPLSTRENLEFLLNSYGITCRYNEIKKVIEINVPWAKYIQDNKMNCAIAEIFSLCSKNSMPKTEIQDYILLIANDNSYNPVADWINSKPWDKTSRLADLLNTLVCPVDDELKKCILFRWLISCVACLTHTNFTSHGVLVFIGHQGVGKTSWFKRLADPSLNAVLDGAIIDAMNKDTIINATSHWLVELGELDATFRKSDISRLKALITQPSDKIRQPYARNVSEYPRRTVFFGSVNDSRYLVDDTGNRRWWTLPVDYINYNHDIDMQQLWAEVQEYYKQGHKWWLEPHELLMLNEHNEEYLQIDPIEEKILSSYSLTDNYSKREITATDVLIEIGFDRPTKAQVNTASKVLKKYFGDAERRKNGRFYNIPVKNTGVTN